MHEQLARVLFFRRLILSTYEGTTPWLLKLLKLAWPIPTELFYPCSHSQLYFFLLTETRRLWFRIVFGISGFFFCKVIAYLANSKSWFGNNLPFPCNMQKSIAYYRLRLGIDCKQAYISALTLHCNSSRQTCLIALYALWKAEKASRSQVRKDLTKGRK